MLASFEDFIRRLNSTQHFLWRNVAFDQLTHFGRYPLGRTLSGLIIINLNISQINYKTKRNRNDVFCCMSTGSHCQTRPHPHPTPPLNVSVTSTATAAVSLKRSLVDILPGAKCRFEISTLFGKHRRGNEKKNHLPTLVCLFLIIYIIQSSVTGKRTDRLLIFIFIISTVISNGKRRIKNKRE